MTNQKIFYHILANNLIASVANAFIWFALTFWVYLTTQSVLSTAYVGGLFAVGNVLSAFLFGTIVDHNRKKMVMIYSSIASLLLYGVAACIYFTTPLELFSNFKAIQLWLLIGTLVLGSLFGSLRMIALSTTVSLLFDEGKDKANGMIGAMNGISFSLTSILSGMVIGWLDMGWAIGLTIVATTIALVYMFFIPLKEERLVVTDENPRNLDVRRTIKVVVAIPGLMMLIFFTTFNNFLGGVFMGLMDAYGLSLVSVQVWGTMFAVASFSFIVGSGLVSKYGLGSNPLRSMLFANGVAWLSAMFFTIQPSVVLLFLGMVIWLAAFPVIEATEQTVIQSVVPLERQGRVFGFAHSVEQAATPITAFLVGPLATFVTIPFMTTGAGVGLIGGWFGVGPDRGMALIFTLAGCIGLVVTLLAFTTGSYKKLSQKIMEVKV